ncbi:Branched-chain-amino-acid aminotransferase [subsurface metagenome]
MEGIVYLNGTLVPAQEAKLSPLDRGFLYGYGLFETMRSYNGRIFRLDRHLARLRRSAAMLALASELEAYDLEQAIYDTLEANRLKDARVRLTVSAGLGERGLAPPSSGVITVFVSAEKLVPPSPQVYRRGIRAAIVSTRRNSLSPLSQLKATAYLDSFVALSQAAALGAEEAILLNERGFIAECSTSNIFLVAGGLLLTPSQESGILPGITREAVLELAQALGIEAVEGEIPAERLLQAEEAFLTTSVREIVPITSVDGKPIGSGRPGAVTKRLMAAYKELVERTLGLSLT